MAWTLPRTWVAGELVTAALGNTHWRDNLSILKTSISDDGLQWSGRLNYSATVTADTPVINIAQTWNAGGVTFTADKINVTDTASAAASLLIDRQVGGASKFKVDKAGVGTFAGGLTIAGAFAGATTGAFSGAVSMAGLTATTGAFSGAVSMAGLTATTGAFSAAVVGTTGQFNNLIVGSSNNSIAQTGTGGSIWFVNATAITVRQDSGFKVRNTADSADAALTAAAATLSGVLTVNGGGSHVFSASVAGAENLLRVRNTHAGDGSSGRIVAGNDTSASLFELVAYSSGTVGTGYFQANATALYAAGAGGMSVVAANAAGTIRFYSCGTTLKALLTADEFLIGKASNSAAVAGHALFMTGLYEATRSGGTVANFNRLTSDGTIIAFQQDNSTEGSISIAGTTTSYNTTSDARLKEDDERASDLSALRALKIYDYTEKKGGRRRRGVFAQEAFAVAPNAVLVGSNDVDEDGRLLQPWMVDYSKFVPDLVVGWQNHEERLAALEHAA